MTLLPLLLFICTHPTPTDDPAVDPAFSATLSRHLKALRDKDYETFAATLPDAGPFSLVLPDGSRLETAEAFKAMHREWFATPGWTMTHEVLHVHQSGDMAFALVKAVYREAERDGKPYRNTLYVSRVFFREQGRWLMRYDQATSAEKQ